jgi:hypothetical protein
MFWKIYFWIALIAEILGIFYDISAKEKYYFGDWVNEAFVIICIIAIYSFAFRKKLFEEIYWKIFGLLLIVSLFIPIPNRYSIHKNVIDFSTLFSTPLNTIVIILILLIIIVFIIPYAYILYALAFGKVKFKKNSK